MQLTLQAVFGQDQFLNSQKLAVQAILNSLDPGGVASVGLLPDTKIPFSHAAILWSFGAVAPRRILPQDAMIVIVQMFAPLMLTQGEIWCKQAESGVEDIEYAPFLLTISDRTLVQVSGMLGYYDLLRCCMHAGDTHTFEGVSYNLAHPVRQEWLRTKREAEHAADIHNKRSPPRPGDTVNGAASDSVRPTRGGDAAVGPDDDPHGAGGGSSRRHPASRTQPADGSHRDGDD